MWKNLKVPTMAVKFRSKLFGEVKAGQSFYLSQTDDSCFMKADSVWSLHTRCWNNMRLALHPEQVVWVLEMVKPRRKKA